MIRRIGRLIARWGDRRLARKEAEYEMIVRLLRAQRETELRSELIKEVEDYLKDR